MLAIYKVYNRKQNMKYYLEEITHVNVQIKVYTWGQRSNTINKSNTSICFFWNRQPPEPSTD